MKKIKYIIYEDCFPVLFSEANKHSDFRTGQEITSAGFCSVFFENEKICVKVYGESISLKLKSKPEDAELIERLFEKSW